MSTFKKIRNERYFFNLEAFLSKIEDYPKGYRMTLYKAYFKKLNNEIIKV